MAEAHLQPALFSAPVAGLGRRLTCTGLSARWCPIHGDCTCDEDAADGLGWHPDIANGANVCPLHIPESTHADG